MFDYYTTFTLSQTRLLSASEIDQRAHPRERERAQLIATHKAIASIRHDSRNLLVRLLSVFSIR